MNCVFHSDHTLAVAGKFKVSQHLMAKFVFIILYTSDLSVYFRFVGRKMVYFMSPFCKIYEHFGKKFLSILKYLANVCGASVGEE